MGLASVQRASLATAAHRKRTQTTADATYPVGKLGRNLETGVDANRKGAHVGGCCQGVRKLETTCERTTRRPTHKHRDIHRYTHIRIHRRAQTPRYTQARTHRRAHTRTHTHIHTHIHTRTYTRTYTRTCTASTTCNLVVDLGTPILGVKRAAADPLGHHKAHLLNLRPRDSAAGCQLATGAASAPVIHAGATAGPI